MKQTKHAWKITLPTYTPKKGEPEPDIIKIIKALNASYFIRKNIVLMRVEMAHKSNQDDWREVNDQIIDTLVVQYRSLKVPVSRSSLLSILNSHFVKRYNPITSYFDSLPIWDGTDYLKLLADTVKAANQAAWETYLKKWIVAMVRCATEDSVTNQQILVFYGKQGAGKTRWINKLLPDKLSSYFYSGQTNLEDQVFYLKLGTNMLIFLDELDAYAGKKQALIKAAITQEKIKTRLMFQNFDTPIIRRASFIAAINHEKFLNDLSGSRRYLVVETLEIDHNHNLNMELVFAQAYHFAKDAEFRHYFEGNEIADIERNNYRHKHKSRIEELIIQNYEQPEEIDFCAKKLTPAEIIKDIQERTGEVVNESANKVGEIMQSLGFPRVSRGTGNDKRYCYHFSIKV